MDCLTILRSGRPTKTPMQTAKFPLEESKKSQSVEPLCLPAGP